MMRRAFLVLALVGLAAVPASAQIAAAVGQPLPSPDLDPGTVSVRVIAGSIGKPIVGTDVTLVVNGTPRIARTDDAGRVFFKDLPSGATVKASVVDEDKKKFESTEFQIADSGVRLLLSTKPLEMGAGGAPFAGGAGGMPEPRQMSGQPRAEQADAPGTITVRLTYDDFKDPQPPANVPVLLAAYRADDTVAVQVANSDKDGRAVFGNLDVKGETSYFAMAELPRNGAVDRMTSIPCVLDARTGVRLVLSAAKRDSKDAPIDDLGKLDDQDHAPGDGKLHVVLEGVPDASSKVRVVAMGPNGARRVISEVQATRAAPDPSNVLAQDQFQARPDAPAHAVHVQVHGGPAGANEPLGGVKIQLIPAKQKTPGEGATTPTPDGGELDLTSDANEPLVAEITINGKLLRSKPFDITKQGGILDIYAQWEAEGKVVADVDMASVTPNDVVFAETTMRRATYRSAPYQPVPGRGALVTLYVLPRVMLSFDMTARVDDEFLAVQARFKLTNNSWAPYVGGPDGLVIPLPKHFKGAQIAEQDQGDVSVAQGEGFRIARPLPPGGKDFHSAFSLPVEDGTVKWSLDLPMGTFDSEIDILQTPGMTVQTPPSVKTQSVDDPRGTFLVLPRLSILPRQSMEMTFSNLPTQPAWKIWAPRVVGALTVLIMLVGLGFALARTSAARAQSHERAAKRAKLLDELVGLEPGGKSDKRRAQITDELESLWDA